VDVISIATPNHWHSLMSIWACQAGKDVYVEKPLSHNLFEGKKLVEAAKKYGRIVQHGTQNRSLSKWSNLANEIASGKKGKLEIALGTCHKRRKSIGFKQVKNPPSELEFDVWTGPAPKEKYHENLVHYNWHWFWNFGNGDIGNQGVHQMDIARWMIPGAVWPKSVVSVGGRFGYKDQAETANTQLAIFDYGESLLVFDVRGLSGKSNMGVSNHVYFDKNAKQTVQKSHGLKGIKDPLATRGQVDIFENFIEAVRNRKEDHLDAHVKEGHVSSGLCHLANLSYRLGEKTGFNKKKKTFGTNQKAHDYFERMQEHLKENGLKLEESDYVVGRTLHFDSKTETIRNDDEANAMLSGTYRPPYVVPKKV
jgi:predicted dehydrogenase